MNKMEVYTKALDNVVQRKLKAFDLFLAEIGSPDKVLDKPYSTFDGQQLLYNWTEQEVNTLTNIIGPDVMGMLIANRELKAVKALEKAAGI
ncbi:MAG: hypothetical protein WC479_09650 [Candidatus Izemoplasmatales bacterium]